MNLTPFFVLWFVLGLVVVGLALYRKLTVVHEEPDLVHLAAGEERDIPHQVELAHKLDVVDRWGKTLTVVTVVTGLVLAAIYLYGAFEKAQLPR